MNIKEIWREIFDPCEKKKGEECSGKCPKKEETLEAYLCCLYCEDFPCPNICGYVEKYRKVKKDEEF